MAHRAPFIFLLLTAFLVAACGTGDGTPPAAEPSVTVTAESAAPATETPEGSVAATETVAPEEEQAIPTPAEEADATQTTAPTAEATETSAPPTEVAAFAPDAVSLVLEPVAEGFAQPLDVVSANDGSGRLFVVEKGGLIRVVSEGAVLDVPFLDLTDAVSGAYEQGLLGLVFEPERPERFYINYTDLNGDTQIVRYTVSEDPNVADPGSAEVLLTLDQPAANHNGGDLAFGPDGYLWIGTGDGGGSGDQFQNAQTAQTLLGAMLRLDVSGETSYTIPQDNPFVDGESGAEEIWATGLRNPWRYSFDRETSDLWVADVGQNAWEEINRVGSEEPLLNYGWPMMEADRCYATSDCDPEGLVMPITQYNHDFGCSVTGGYVYRGADYPSLVGGYFFADFCSGLMWGIPSDAGPGTEPTQLLATEMQISSFGEDEEGELYLLDFGGGVLYRVTAE